MNNEGLKTGEHAGKDALVSDERQQLDQAVRLLRRARVEISELRERIDYLQPRAEAFNLLKEVVGNRPMSDGSYACDHRWAIDTFLKQFADKPWRPELDAELDRQIADKAAQLDQAGEVGHG